MDDQIKIHIAPLTNQLEDLTRPIQGMSHGYQMIPPPQCVVPVLVLWKLVRRPTWWQLSTETFSDQNLQSLHT